MASAYKTVELGAKHFADVNVTVRVGRICGLRMRMSVLLIRLAAWVSPFTWEFQETEEHGAYELKPGEQK